MKISKKIVTFKSNVNTLYKAIKDPRVTWYIKFLTLILLAYIISPVDLVPDFIPILGLLDEAILVPVAVSLIVKLIPEHIANDYRDTSQNQHPGNLRYLGVILVFSIWLLLIWLIIIFWTNWN
jgi:uncharacterized membrane protein YkvA (DUF1232 family)